MAREWSGKSVADAIVVIDVDAAMIFVSIFIIIAIEHYMHWCHFLLYSELNVAGDFYDKIGTFLETVFLGWPI